MLLSAWSIATARQNTLTMNHANWCAIRAITALKLPAFPYAMPKSIAAPVISLAAGPVRRNIEGLLAPGDC
jgi:hypothetical protein